MSRKRYPIWWILLAWALVFGACAEEGGETVQEAEQVVEPAGQEALQEDEQAIEQAETEATEEVPQAGQEPTQEMGEEVQEGGTAVPEVQEAAGGGFIEGSELVGYSVRNAAGESIGEVADAVIDLARQQVLFLTLRFGGLLGLGEEVIPVPLNRLNWDVDQNVLRLDIAQDTLERIEALPGDWPDLEDPNWFGDAQNLMQQMDLGAAPLGESWDAGTLVLLTDLLGRGIRSPGDEGLAEIEDVLIELKNGRVPYAVASFGGFLGLGAERFLVPLHAFRLAVRDEGGIEGDLILDITEEQLESAPVYDSAARGFTDPNWDAEIRAFWNSLGIGMAEPAGEAEAGVTEEEEAGVGRILANVYAPDAVASRLGTVLGATVEGIDGQALGQIEDVLVNLESGAVAYLVLSPQGDTEAMAPETTETATPEVSDTAEITETEAVTGTEEVAATQVTSGRLIPIPAGVLAWGEEQDAFVIYTDPEVLLAAPQMEADDRSFRLGDPFLEEEVTGYWIDAVGHPVAPGAVAYGRQPVSGPFGTFRGLPLLLFPASQIIGQPVLSPESEEPMGTIEDLIYSAGAVRYAALSVSDEEGNGQAIVPLYALLYNHEANEFYMDMPLPADAPRVNLGELDLVDPGWSEPVMADWEETGYITQPGMRMLASSLILAERLMGFPVMGADGNQLGEIDDLVIDADSGVVRYVAINFGGFLGLGEETFLIPLTQLTLSTFNGWLVADMDEEMLESAPSFSTGEWLGLNAPDWDREFRSFWGLEEVDVTNTDANETSGPAIRAQNLLEWSLLGPGNEEVGRIDDLIIDLFEARVRYVAVESEGYLDFEEHAFLVPFQHISRLEGQEAIRLDVDPARLEDAPVFDETLWAEGLVTPTFREEVDAYWNTGAGS